MARKELLETADGGRLNLYRLTMNPQTGSLLFVIEEDGVEVYAHKSGMQAKYEFGDRAHRAARRAQA